MQREKMEKERKKQTRTSATKNWIAYKLRYVN